MTGSPWTRPALFGVAACALLLGVYAGVLTQVSGREFLLTQVAQYWYFILALAAGFGAQIALYVRLRDVARHRDATGKVAVSGGTSTAAMISCCAHYHERRAGARRHRIIAVVAQYQTELFWVGLAFNVAGIVYVGRKTALATRT